MLRGYCFTWIQHFRPLEQTSCLFWQFHFISQWRTVFSRMRSEPPWGIFLCFETFLCSHVNERALMQQSLQLHGWGHTIEAFDFSYKLVRCSSHRHSGDALRSWTLQQPGPQHITVEVKGVGPGGLGMERQKEARRNSAKGYSYL